MKLLAWMACMRRANELAAASQVSFPEPATEEELIAAAEAVVWANLSVVLQRFEHVFSHWRMMRRMVGRRAA